MADPQSYWTLSAADVEAALGVGPDGLTMAQASERLSRFGPNLLEVRRRSSVVGAFAGQFKSPIVLILIFAALLSAFLRDWTDSLIVLGIVLASATLSFYQEYGASRAAERLRAQIQVMATVLREGEARRVAMEEVVPGDIALLSAGSLVPGDGLVLEAHDFFVNQSALTGESLPVEKTPAATPAGASLAERSNAVYLGTNVRSGTARVLVVHTGRGTAFGQIAHRLSLRPPETEFEHGLRRFGYLLTEIMLVLVLLVFAINVFFHKAVLDSLLFSLALAVGLTPQLLPAIISVNLSRGSQAMAARGVIVRRLAAIENFGSMDILCTDKTGTLTEGSVRLESALDIEGRASDEVLRAAGWNAHFQTGLANTLDEALVVAAEARALLSGPVRKVDEIPYDFVRKRLGVVVEEEGSLRLIVKGALGNVLEVCNRVRRGGEPVALDQMGRASVREAHTGWSGQGYRVLGVATREVEARSAYHREDEHDLIFEGYLLFFDPPKPDALEAVTDLASMGVRLKIITGDNRLVAAHTAQAVGLAEPRVVTGEELQATGDEALRQVAEQADVFAAVDPNQKERLILSLKKAGHVVGFMGDGINDAPALHAADVGISVDSAVDVAKEAADFVLLRKDLAVLHQGMLEGRRTFANTLKYVFMATSANFGNMFSVAGASLFLSFLPMLPKQILLINFLTDLPEMAISTDNVDEAWIERPHRWDVGFIRRFMLAFGTLSSVFDYLTFGALLLFHARPELFRSAWFLESILSASLVVLAVRTRRSMFRNWPSRLMLALMGVTCAVAVALPYTPLAGPMGFVPIPVPVMATVLAIILAYLGAAETAKRRFFRRADAGILRSRT
jgi:Mg2+-importing ATPase